MKRFMAMVVSIFAWAGVLPATASRRRTPGQRQGKQGCSVITARDCRSVAVRTCFVPGAFVLLAMLALASTARAQLFTPVAIGSAQGPTGSSTITTTTQTVPAGTSIIVMAVALGFEGIFAPESAVCSDSANDVYNTDASALSGADVATLTILCSTQAIASPLLSGSTITVTWSGGLDGYVATTQAFSVTGLASVALDQTAGNYGFGATPSSGPTATTAQPNELLFGAISGFTGDFTPGMNGTAHTCASTGTSTYSGVGGVVGADAASIFGEYCLVSATDAYEATGNIDDQETTFNWDAVLATYVVELPPSLVISNLLTQFQSGVLPEPGKSMEQKLTAIANDVSSDNGLACSDLTAFANAVKAQSGKKVGASQAAYILTQAEDISTSLDCPG